VYKYPVIHKDSPAEIGLGHCSHVTNVRFSHGKRSFVTTLTGQCTAYCTFAVLNAISEAINASACVRMRVHTTDDTFLFSAGGADTALFQWKLV